MIDAILPMPSNKIRIEQTVPDHFLQINTGERHKHENVAPRQGFTAVTLFFKDEIVGIVGGNLIAPGILQAWGLISDSVSKCPISFHKTVLGLSSYYMDLLKLRRIQFSVRDDFERGIEWANRLGFYPEGLMRNYAMDGCPHWLFSRVRGPE